MEKQKTYGTLPERGSGDATTVTDTPVAPSAGDSNSIANNGTSRDGKAACNGSDVPAGPCGASDWQLFNKGTEEELVCVGYRLCTWKVVLFWIGVVLTLGILLLVTYWRPEWKVKITKDRCRLLVADTVVLRDVFGNVFVQPVTLRRLQEGYTTYSSVDPVNSKSPGDFAYLDTDGATVTDMDDTTVLTVRPRLCLRYVDHHDVRYMWDQTLEAFSRLDGLPEGTTIGQIHDDYKGLTEKEELYKIQVFGENSIDVDVKSYATLFFQEVLNPFYIFQICSVILWSLDQYYVYAACIVFISAVSLGVELYEIRKQSENLRAMVAAAETTTSVVRPDGDTAEVMTSQLVPGDVILIPPRGCLMMCDAVLLTGNAIVNESMLTGESLPVTKTPITPSEGDEVYSLDIHKRHTLFSGTQVIQTRFYGDGHVKAVVVRTGFSTAKGELVRSILFPKPMGFKFYQDAMKFIGFLACIATLGMIYSIFILIRNGETADKVVIRALDIITIVVPPALPAAMTVGTAYAQSRLKKQAIFCISPQRINICGKLKLIVFDKTGTLTEEGLDMWGVIPMIGMSLGKPLQNPAELPRKGSLVIAMATCHSLTIIEGELTGDPLDLKMFNSINWVMEEPGTDTSKFDNLMPTVVRPIGETEDDDDVPFEVGVVRQFPFSSGLQRMSVIVRVLGAEQMDFYCKGAPEKVATLCDKSTLPSDFYDVLQRYTMKGYRVIAVAYRPLDRKLSWHQAQRITREEAETALTFLGLLVMENMLKPETTPVITQLHQAEIRTVMATGDNILTAVSVARQCGMVLPGERVILVNATAPEYANPAKIEWELASNDPLGADREGGEEAEEGSIHSDPDSTTNLNNAACSTPEVGIGDEVAIIPETSYETLDVESGPVRHRCHLAMSGRSFGIIAQYFPALMSRVCVRGTVFARMSPDQKAQLVENLMEIGYCVGMCGDGANDCGALKAAHAGISLSEAEASVASPFTSRTPNIECVPTVIREGRAALVTSFGVFKYMALYSIIQFVSVLILYTMRTNFSDWMFLYIDLLITTTVAFLMGHTAAYHKLVAKRPPGSLVGPSNIFSIIIHITIVCVLQTCAFLYLAAQPWYVPNDGGDVEVQQTFETTVIFYISSFQYLILAFIFSKGPPYRKPIWTNVPFLIALILLTACTLLVVLNPFWWISYILLLVDLPSFVFRVTIVGLAAINLCLALLLESLVIPSALFIRLCNAIRRKRAPKNRYKLIERELEDNPYWPPVGHMTMAREHQDTATHRGNPSIN